LAATRTLLMLIQIEGQDRSYFFYFSAPILQISFGSAKKTNDAPPMWSIILY
jgi:hypothetical protein